VSTPKPPARGRSSSRTPSRCLGIDGIFTDDTSESGLFAD
jgi:hypothetical protein